MKNGPHFLVFVLLTRYWGSFYFLIALSTESVIVELELQYSSFH